MPQDDAYVTVLRRDMAGGMNTRQDEQVIADNQATNLENVALDTPGQTTLRAGATLVEDLSNDAGTGAVGFEPDGGTNVIVVTHGQKLETYTGSGTFTERKTDFTTNLVTNMFKAGESGIGDVLLVTNGTDNWFRFDPADWGTPQDLGNTSGTGTDSPPKGTIVGCYFRNRVWILKDNLLYFSAAFPADYAVAFDTVSDVYNIPCGTERALLPLRDTGIVILGQDQIWGLNPSVTPAATDKPEKLLDLGCTAGNTAKQVGDDITFLANDGVRGVFRTQQDKLQMGQSYPLSYYLKTEFEEINWSKKANFDAVYFDNKYILTLTTGTTTYNNKMWAYYPAFNAWVVITGLNIARFAKVVFNGEERLYGIDSNDGSVYRLFSGTTDAGTAIAYTEEGRAEDCGKPFQWKVGGEYKLKAKGGTGTLVVSANPDGQGYSQLGTLSLAVTGVTFPTIFPVTFNTESEANEVFHLEQIGRFKRVKFKIYCNTSGAVIKILERELIGIVEEYQPEDY